MRRESERDMHIDREKDDEIVLIYHVNSKISAHALFYCITNMLVEGEKERERERGGGGGGGGGREGERKINGLTYRPIN